MSVGNNIWCEALTTPNSKWMRNPILIYFARLAFEWILMVFLMPRLSNLHWDAIPPLAALLAKKPLPIGGDGPTGCTVLLSKIQMIPNISKRANIIILAWSGTFQGPTELFAPSHGSLTMPTSCSRSCSSLSLSSFPVTQAPPGISIWTHWTQEIDAFNETKCIQNGSCHIKLHKICNFKHFDISWHRYYFSITWAAGAVVKCPLQAHHEASDLKCTWIPRIKIQNHWAG